MTDWDRLPITLTAEDVAALLHRKPGGIKKAAQLGAMVPAPFQKRPWLWRKVDLQAYVEHPHAFRRPRRLRRAG